MKHIPVASILLLIVSPYLSLAFENPNCQVVIEQNDNFDVLTGIRLMEQSVETDNATIETIYGDSGRPSKQRAIVNSTKGPIYDAVMALTLSSDGKHYAYTALEDGKLFPVIDGRRQQFELSVNTDCCGVGGHWFELWQYTEYIFAADGKRVAFLEISEDGYRLIMDGKVVDDASMLGGFQFSPNGKHLAYFTKEPELFPKVILLVVNGNTIWNFDVRRYPIIGRENVGILSFNNDSIAAVGYNEGKLVRVSCKLEDIEELRGSADVARSDVATWR